MVNHLGFTQRMNRGVEPTEVVSPMKENDMSFAPEKSENDTGV